MSAEFFGYLIEFVGGEYGKAAAQVDAREIEGADFIDTDIAGVVQIIAGLDAYTQSAL